MSWRVFAALVAAGFVARLALLLTSVGTNDVVFMNAWADLALRYGIAGAYAYHPLLNHPPLSVAIFRMLAIAAETLRVDMTDLLRLVQSVADTGSALCLVVLGRAAGEGQGKSVALWFYLAPAAIFISAFHGNTDPTMVFLILLAAVFALRGWGFAAGVTLALATGIKILPLLVVPLFVVYPWRARFLAGYAAVFAAIFGPAIAIGGAPVVRNIFGYAGWPEWWGVSAILTDLSRALGNQALKVVAAGYLVSARFILVLALGAVWWTFARGERTARRLLAAVGVVYLVTLVVAPGAGVQYFVWPLPFLPFLATRRLAAAISAAAGLLIFAMYTSWSGGFPWYFADSMPHPWRGELLLRAGAHCLWVMFAAGAVTGLRALWARTQASANKPQ